MTCIDPDILKGLEAPPLVDGKFCLDTYHAWLEANKLRPFDMTLPEYKTYLISKQKPVDNPFQKAEQTLTRLANMRYWFVAVEDAISKGLELRQEVIEDYKWRVEHGSEKTGM